MTGSSAEPALSIREVADRTGVAASTLRMWEVRYGFPQPRRLDGGHRRYDPADVVAIREVVRRRDRGARLDAAIDQVARGAQRLLPTTPSVFAELRSHHPELAVQRLRKSTLRALSWSIEDEFCARAERPHLFASFQHQEFYESALPRWSELARLARSAYVLADFPRAVDDAPLVAVHLDGDAPMRREWAVVCDAPGFAVALSAWELPGQNGVPDRDRAFESTWTLDPHAVRSAARVCARVAAESGATGALAVLDELAAEPVDAPADVVSATALFNRVVAYVDRARG